MPLRGGGCNGWCSLFLDNSETTFYFSPGCLQKCALIYRITQDDANFSSRAPYQMYVVL